MSKLGLHVNVIRPELAALLQQKPSVVKILDHNVEYWRQFKQQSPSSFLVGRVYLPETEQRLDQPGLRGREMAERLYPIAAQMRGIYDCWEGYNEKGCNTTEEARVFNEFAVSFAEAMRTEGHKVAAYSFATGNPELNMWPYLLDGLRASDYLALHEYSAPTMRDNETWLCLRYRRVYKVLPLDCHKPLVITECGIDGGVIGRVNEGWSDFCKGESYMNDLAWYDKALMSDPQVIGATIYCAGIIDKTWRTFNILGTSMDGMLRGYWHLNKPEYWHRAEPTYNKEKVKVMDVEYSDAESRWASRINYEGRFEKPPHIIVLHGTAGPYEAACNWFANPKARASAHFVVGFDGRVAQCIPVGHIGWHAGSSSWHGYSGVNRYSIGIELETDSRGHSDWPLEQLQATEKLVRWLVELYGITPDDIVTHAQIAIPPGRKVDPIGFPLIEFKRRVFGESMTEPKGYEPIKNDTAHQRQMPDRA